MVLAYLDIETYSPGIEPMFKDILLIAEKLAEVYRDALGAKAVNILHASGREAQQHVFHFCIHKNYS